MGVFNDLVKGVTQKPYTQPAPQLPRFSFSFDFCFFSTCLPPTRKARGGVLPFDKVDWMLDKSISSEHWGLKVVSNAQSNFEWHL